MGNMGDMGAMGGMGDMGGMGAPPGGFMASLVDPSPSSVRANANATVQDSEEYEQQNGGE